jgi:hypothetical protein
MGCKKKGHTFPARLLIFFKADTVPHAHIHTPRAVSQSVNLLYTKDPHSTQSNTSMPHMNLLPAYRPYKRVASKAQHLCHTDPHTQPNATALQQGQGDTSTPNQA